MFHIVLYKNYFNSSEEDTFSPNNLCLCDFLDSIFTYNYSIQRNICVPNEKAITEIEI